MENKKNGSAKLSITQTALIPQAALVVISILWILIFPNDNIIKYFNFNTSNIIIGLSTGIIIAILGYMYYLYAKRTPSLNSTVELFEKLLAPTYRTLGYSTVVLLSLIAGICEESFFRGLLFNKIGMITSSIAFGLLHFPGWKYWIYALWAFCSAIIFCYLLILTGSLITPILAHAINNIIGMILLKNLKTH